MARVRVWGEAVRNFILQHVERHPADIARVAVERFRISRQAVNRHLQRLVEERALTKRLLARIDRFRTVLFDFTGVESA